MKNILLLAVIMVIASPTFAQKADSMKLIQKVTGGAVFGTVASTTLTESEPPFELGYNLLANVTLATKRTYHNFLYGFGDNSARLLNGYFLPNNWDAYLLYSKQLHTSGQYLGLGIEKMIRVENVKFFLLSEVGTNLKGKEFLSFGVLMSFQNQIWKR